MKTSIPKLLVLVGVLLPLLHCNSLQAQIAPEEDLHQYFDDGGLSTRKNLIATDLLAPLAGAVTLRYERGLTKNFSMEVGVSKLLPFYVFEVLPLNGTIAGFHPKGGFGFSVAPHLFFAEKAPERSFIGLKYGFRRYSLEDGGFATIHDFSTSYGYNIFLGKHLMFCYQFGFGYRRILRTAPTVPNGPYGGYAQTRGVPFLPWMLGIGAMF